MNTIESVILSPEREAKLSALLVQTRRIVERVGTAVYGECRVRDFRRDLPTGVLDDQFTPEERTVIRSVRSAEAEIVHAYIGMVGQVASSYINMHHHLGVDIDDLTQEGCHALILAMYGYNGFFRMSTYFYHAAQRRMEDIRRQKGRPKRFATEVSFNDETFVTEDRTDAEWSEESGMMRAALATAKLTPLERAVLTAYAGGVTNFSEVARSLINPKSLKPYTRAAGSQAYITGVEKVRHQHHYLTLLSTRKTA